MDIGDGDGINKSVGKVEKRGVVYVRKWMGILSGGGDVHEWTVIRWKKVRLERGLEFWGV